MTQFGSYSQYYDLLYRDKDYIGESRYVRALLDEFTPAAQQLLELGCGTGRHAELLAIDGLHVTGVEISPEMLEQAKERVTNLPPNCAGSFHPKSGDVRTFDIDQHFDAVISLFHVASYQTSNEDIDKMFATASSHLEPGGAFIFDVWYGPAVLTLKPAARVKRMEDDSIHVLRIAEPTVDVNANQVHVDYTMFMTDKATAKIESLSETHHMRFYFQPELELLASNHGFTLVHTEEWLTRSKPADSTWGVVFVLRKN